MLTRNLTARFAVDVDAQIGAEPLRNADSLPKVALGRTAGSAEFSARHLIEAV